MIWESNRKSRDHVLCFTFFLSLVSPFWGVMTEKTFLSLAALYIHHVKFRSTSIFFICATGEKNITC